MGGSAPLSSNAFTSASARTPTTPFSTSAANALSRSRSSGLSAKTVTAGRPWTSTYASSNVSKSQPPFCISMNAVSFIQRNARRGGVNDSIRVCSLPGKHPSSATLVPPRSIMLPVTAAIIASKSSSIALNPRSSNLYASNAIRATAAKKRFVAKTLFRTAILDATAAMGRSYDTLSSDASGSESGSWSSSPSASNSTWNSSGMLT